MLGKRSNRDTEEDEKPEAKPEAVKLVAPLKKIPGELGEPWTVVTLPAADKMFEPINMEFTVRRQSDNRAFQFTLECLTYGKKGLSKHKNKTYIDGEPNTRADLKWESGANANDNSTTTAHVYLDKDGSGRFRHMLHDMKIMIQRDPVYLGDPGL